MGKTTASIIAKNILADYIKSRVCVPGGRLPTVRDMEKQYAPVSRNTVVQALSILQTEGWLEKKQGSGCYVSDRSITARQAKTGLMGFITPSSDELSHLVFRLHEGIERVAKLNDMNVLLSTFNFSYEKEQQEVKRLTEMGCECVIVYPAVRYKDQLDDDYLRHEYLDYPLVLVDAFQEVPDRLSVTFDNYRAGFDMTELIIKQGHRRIAFMSFENPGRPIDYFPCRERLRGYRDAMRLADLPVREEDIWKISWDPASRDIGLEDVDRAMHQWKDQPERASALLALDDRFAMFAAHCAENMDVRIPDDLYLAGFDNLPLVLPAAFPTTDPDFRRMGELAAWAALAARARKEHFGMNYILQVPILQRG